jgi:hypothetical protein
MIRIGSKFEWCGKLWTIASFTAQHAVILCGSLRSRIELSILQSLV